MLTLVGLSHGFVNDSSQRTRGIGADIIVRSPDSHIGTVGLSNMPVKLIDRLEKLPHVTFGTGVASHLVSGWTTVSGIDLPAFERMSGKFVFREGHSFEKPDDILLDTYYAQQAHVHAGSRINLLNREWNVAGIVEPGKLAHIFLPLATLQDLDGTTGKVAQIYLKLDDPANTNIVVNSIKNLLPGYNVYGVEELVSLTSVDNVPFLRPLLNVIIGVAGVVRAAVAFFPQFNAGARGNAGEPNPSGPRCSLNFFFLRRPVRRPVASL